jgi:hypothetical protein
MVIQGSRLNQRKKTELEGETKIISRFTHVEYKLYSYSNLLVDVEKKIMSRNQYEI